VPVSAEPDPEGRVVLSNDHWILLRPTARSTVPVENRRRLHGAKLCLDRNDKGERMGELHTSVACPAHADGAHRMVDQGREESMYANRFECQCGLIRYAKSDENTAIPMIKLLLFAILFVIAWPLALLVALSWLAVLILRVCFGLTVLGLKAAAATGIGAKMLHDRTRSSQGASHASRTSNWTRDSRPHTPVCGGADSGAHLT
jgi:hypothetical protein